MSATSCPNIRCRLTRVEELVKIEYNSDNSDSGTTNLV